MMKKILIIEDTPANLDAAKAYFSTVSGYEFLYATNRKEAEELLPEVYAVITDRSLPYSQDSLLGCDFPAEYKEKVSDNYIMANGHTLLFKALLSGRPAIMASEHGTLMILKGRSEPDAEGLKNTTLPENFSLQDALEKVSIDPVYEDMVNIWRYGHFVGTDTIRTNLVKTEESAWKRVWEELQKQF